MKLKDITVEAAIFLIGSGLLGYGLYQESGAGLLLIIATLILITAPDEE